MSFTERFHEILAFKVPESFSTRDNKGGDLAGRSISMVTIVPLPQLGQRSGL